MTPADGTLVCLNARSKLRFPVQFSGITRKVELEGEGYFQVVRNEEMPFVVSASGVNITVLGTEFNVSNYPENEDVQTTLIKGKVQVTLSENMDGYTLHPGEQVVYNKESGEVTVVNVDVSYVTAWREGRLRFRDRPLKEIMDFISRWYDVDVVYEDEVVKNYLFGCNFNRHVTVTPLLELFQSTGTVRFEVVGKKIIVKKWGYPTFCTFTFALFNNTKNRVSLKKKSCSTLIFGLVFHDYRLNQAATLTFGEFSQLEF